VSDISKNELRELYEARELIEIRAALKKNSSGATAP
jgi:DNA-binding GntR family transcriptional regulator